MFQTLTRWALVAAALALFVLPAGALAHDHPAGPGPQVGPADSGLSGCSLCRASEIYPFVVEAGEPEALPLHRASAVAPSRSSAPRPSAPATSPRSPPRNDLPA